MNLVCAGKSIFLVYKAHVEEWVGVSKFDDIRKG